MRTTCFTVLLLLLSFRIHAQAPSFIQHYKEFRALTDSFTTYYIYLTPYQQKQRISLTQYSRSFENAFHFLRTKHIKRKDPDFLLVISVPVLDIKRPHEQTLFTERGADYYQVKVQYALSLQVDVYAGGKEMYSFPLCSDTLLTKTYKYADRRSYEFEDPFTRKEEAQYQTRYTSGQKIQTGTNPSLDDIKAELQSILGLYKNYFIDKVDWRYSQN